MLNFILQLLKEKNLWNSFFMQFYMDYIESKFYFGAVEWRERVCGNAVNSSVSAK